MKAHRKQKLILIAAGLAVLALALTFVGIAMRNQINLYYSPTDIASGLASPGQTFRAGGLVVEGSVSRDEETLFAQFTVTDGAQELVMQYIGILPDLFREGQGIVAQGSLNEAGIFVADEVFAKHDENYLPAEVEESLKASGHDYYQKGYSSDEKASDNSEAYQ